jgi:hypothetical protein
VEKSGIFPVKAASAVSLPAIADSAQGLSTGRRRIDGAVDNGDGDRDSGAESWIVPGQAVGKNAHSE